MRLLFNIKQFTSGNNLIAVFLLRSAIIFTLWLVLYKSGFLDVSGLDGFLINNLIITSEKVLHLMSYDTFRFDNHVGIHDSSGVLIGPPCNAFSLFVLYAGFLLAFPGQLKKKSYFLVLGILVIHLLNIIRVIALILLAYHNPAALEFNHSYTFTLVVYLSIFGMWMLWIRQYSAEKSFAKN